MRKILFILISISIVQIFCGCESEEDRRQAAKESKEQLRKEDSAAFKVGVMSTIDCLPIVVAKELRLFDTLGVDVHLRHFHALSECRYAITNSLVEGAAIDSMLMNQIKAEGTALTPKLHTDLYWQFLTAKKSRISRISQMADKIIGTDSHGMSHHLAELAIDSMIRHKQNVFVVQVEDVGVREKMLTSGSIDAALLPEPYASKAIKQGAKVINTVKSKPCGVIAFRDKALKNTKRQQQLNLFLKAVSIAKDSIKQYGQEKYIHLLK